jgi:hypothetical protein
VIYGISGLEKAKKKILRFDFKRTYYGQCQTPGKNNFVRKIFMLASS